MNSLRFLRSTLSVAALSILGSAALPAAIITTSNAGATNAGGLDNVALEGTAAQTTLAWGGQPGRINDGNTDGAFGGNSVIHTMDQLNFDGMVWVADPGSTTTVGDDGLAIAPNTASKASPQLGEVVNGRQFVEVRLDGIYDIYEIALFNRTDCCKPRTGNYRLSIRTGGFEQLGANFHTGGTSVDNNWSVLDDSGAPLGRGQVIRLELIGGINTEGNRIINMSEIQVYGSFVEAAPGEEVDTDLDGLPDIWELGAFGDLGQSGTDDTDSDGVDNTREFRRGSSPTNSDSDGDGLSDGDEAALGLNPGRADTDGDGIDDGKEVLIGTYGGQADTDGDGLTDTSELAGAIAYRQTFTGADGTADLGDGSVLAGENFQPQITGNALRLTQDGVASILSSYRLPALGGFGERGFLVTFDFALSGGGARPADGFAFNFGNLPAGNGGGEEGFGAGLAIEFDTWDNEGEGSTSGIGVDVSVNGADAAILREAAAADPTNNRFYVFDGQPREVCILYRPVGAGGLIDVVLNGETLHSGVPVNWQPAASDIVAFSARTGGATETLLVDNLTLYGWTTSDPRNASICPVAPVVQGVLTVRNIQANIPLDSMAAFQGALGNPAQVSSEVTVEAASVHYADNNPNFGNFAPANPYPLFGAYGEHDDFGIHVTGTLFVAQAGTWTFVNNSDDGGLLLIDGATVVDDGGLHGSRNVFGSVALTEGEHSLEYFNYERGGGANGEIVIVPVPGVFTSFGQLRLLQSASTSEVLANSIADWVPATQGAGGWHYGYLNVTPTNSAPGAYDAGTFIEFPAEWWDGAQWDNPGDVNPPWTEIAQTTTHPNGDNNVDLHWSIRRWVSDYDGEVEISWTTSKSNPNCGNGVTGAVALNGAIIDSATIAFDDSPGVSRSVVATIATGDVIDLINSPWGTDNNNNDGCDGSNNSLEVATVAEGGGKPPIGDPVVIGPGGFTVRNIKAAAGVLLDSQARFEQALANPADVEVESTTQEGLIEFFDTGGNGRFLLNLPIPLKRLGLVTTADIEDWGIYVTADLVVNVAGTWTFGSNTDDGGLLRINGVTVVDDSGLHGPQDAFGHIDLPVGTHSLQYWMYERGGGSGAELFVSAVPGDTATAVAAGQFVLLEIAPADSDGDGIDDFDEQQWYGTLEFDLDDDPDADRLTIRHELELGADPTNQDTDGDGIWDGEEWLCSTFGQGTDPTLADTDGDGLSDGEELALGTNGNSQDTDHDGVLDGFEVANAGCLYEQNFDGHADGTTNLGDGSSIATNVAGTAQVVGGALRLTDALVGSTNSDYRLPVLAGLGGGFQATFDYNLFDIEGGNPPADGFSFNLGPISGIAAPGGSEEGYGAGLSVEFDTWDNGGGEIGHNVAVNNVDVPGGFNPVGPLVDGAWHSVTVSWQPAVGGGTIDVLVDGSPIFQSLATPGFTPQAGDIFAFTARTGGATETLLIDNLCISGGVRTDPLDPDVPGLGSLLKVQYDFENVGGSLFLLDFGNEGPNAHGTAEGWDGISNLVQDTPAGLTDRAGAATGVTITALDDGFNPNLTGAPGTGANYDGIEVPQAVNDDYLFKIADVAGTSARMRVDGLPAGDYNVTVFEGRTNDGPGQFGKIWTSGSVTSYVSAFTQNGYDGSGLGGANGDGRVIAGNSPGLNGRFAFNNMSAGFGGGSFIESVASLGSFAAGSEISISFHAAHDEGFIQTPAPNWEIDSVVIESGGELLNVDFSADDGGFTVSGTNVTGPWVYNAAGGTWSMVGAEGVVFSSLDSPSVVVPADGEVTVRFMHRYNFEDDGTTRWDGGGVFVTAGTAEPADQNTGNFAAGSGTVAVSIAEGDSLFYRHLEDGSGGISGMIIRGLGGAGATVANAGSLGDGTVVNLQPDTLVGASDSPSPGGPGAIQLNGVNGAEATYVNTNASADLAGINGAVDYTMMAWVKPSAVAGDNMVFGQLPPPDNSLHNGIRDGAYHFGHWGNDVTVGSVEVAAWHHVAWRYAGGNQTILVDGEPIGSALRGPLSNPSNLLVGISNNNGAFEGMLDDVRVYCGPLSDSKIRTIAGLEPGGDDLVVSYQFEGGIGPVIPNEAPGPEGTLVAGSGRDQIIGTFGQGSPSAGGPGVVRFGGINGAGAAYINTNVNGDAAGINGAQDYTLMAWVKADTAAGDNMVFGQISPPDNVLHNGIRDGAYHQGHWGNDITAGVVEVGVWRHVAWRYANGVQSIVVDGATVGEAARGPLANANNLIVGLSMNNGAFEGYLDDVRVYRTGLSNDSILQIAGFGDSDGNGLADWWERLHFGAVGQDPSGDADGDGLDNAGEADAGSNPFVVDSDGDGLSDGQEVNVIGSNPLSTDTDGDSLTDGEEVNTLGTSATLADTDGDSFSDSVEIDAGTDPLDPLSKPASFTVEMAQYATEAADMNAWEARFNDPAQVPTSDSVTESHTVINFSDNADGHFGANEPFPLFGVTGDHNNYFVRATADILIEAPGMWTFGVNSDDGFRVRIDGAVAGEFVAPRGSADTFFAVDLAAGVHDVELTFFENGGGAQVEFFVANQVGVFNAWDASLFELVRAHDAEGDIAGQTASQPVVLDSDGDGMSDAAELLAGTDRFDASDYFRVTAIELEGGSLLLEVPTVEGRVYEIEFSESLETGTWEVVDRVTGDGSVLQLEDPDPDRRTGSREGYYRVRLAQ